jgi:hypothetical protein
MRTTTYVHAVNRAQRRAAERRAGKARATAARPTASSPQAAQPRAVVLASPPDAAPVADELDALLRVRRAAQRRAAAERELSEAMREARDAGVSFGRIGSAVGVSAQAVRQRLLRAPD